MQMKRPALPKLPGNISVRARKIILDSGTTVLELAKLVNDIPDLTVVTNDLHIASEVVYSPMLLC